MTATVAARLAALCLDAKGHLSGNAYASMAVRAGLLVDLTLAGRLSQTDDSIDLDTTPLGAPSADRALAELAVLDGRTLDWWLEHGHVGLRDVADDLVGEGSWERLPRQALLRDPRFSPRSPEEGARDAAVSPGREPAQSAGDAAVTALAAAAGLAASDRAGPAEELPAGTDSAAWVVRLATDHITETRIQGTAVGQASQTALWTGPI
ncbi:MAG: hypothetical protein JWO98_4235 [Frankiales bacterium]|nr:hypothetical protein [Frankiales bacterium]